MFLPYTREQLLNAFNKANKTNIRLQDVKFVNAGVWLQAGCNARVTVQALPTSENVSGTFEILYNRYEIADTLKGIRLAGKPGTYKTTHDVVKWLREQNGVDAWEDDFFLSNIAANATTVSLIPRVDSVSWLPPNPLVLTFDP